MRAGLLVLPLLLAVPFLGACLDEPVLETQDIVSAIPWPDSERSEYVLLDHKDLEEHVGTGVLSIERQGEQFELRANFEGQGESDQSAVLVDDTTLKPATVHREHRNEDGKVVAVDATYDTAAKEIRTVITEDGDERSIPRRLDEEHYYDNESSLFLWRTIDFREDYSARYYAILANQGGTKQLVRLEVQKKETVTVPAGTFDCWRIEIKTSNVRQRAWYADTPERPLIQYDNSRNIFQLTKLPESPTPTP